MKNIDLFDLIISLTFGVILTLGLQYLQKSTSSKTKFHMSSTQSKIDSYSKITNKNKQKFYQARAPSSLEGAIKPIIYRNNNLNSGSIKNQNRESQSYQISDGSQRRNGIGSLGAKNFGEENKNKAIEEYLIQEMNLSAADAAAISSAKMAMEEQINHYKVSQSEMLYDGSINEFNISSYNEYQKVLFQILGPEKVRQFSQWTSDQEVAYYKP